MIEIIILLAWNCIITSSIIFLLLVVLDSIPKSIHNIWEEFGKLYKDKERLRDS